MREQISEAWGQIKHFTGGAVGIVVILNALVAVAAFTKDVFFASYMGTSANADALTLAYFIPDMLGANLLAPAIGVACVPLFAKLYALGQRERFILSIRNLLYMFTIVSLLLLVLASCFQNTVIGWISGSGPAEGETFRLVLRLYVVLIPIILFYPWFVIGSSVLQSANRFTVAAAGPLLINGIYLTLVLLSIGLGISPESGLYLIAGGITAAVAGAAVMVWSSLRRVTPLLPVLQVKGILNLSQMEKTDLRQAAAVFIPYVFILLSTQAVYFVERSLAARLDTGTVAGLNYAFRLSQFPIWVYVTAVSAVMLPALSKLTALGNKNELHRVLTNSMKQIVLISLPTALCLFILRIPIVVTLFQRGAFDNSSVQITANILEGYSIMVIGQAVLAIGLRYFLAEGTLGYPIIVFAVTAILTVAGDFLLVPLIGAKGIGYAAAVGTGLNACLLMAKMLQRTGYPILRLAGRTWRIILANAAFALLLLLVGSGWHFFEHTELLRIAYLAILLPICFLIYGGLLVRMRLIGKLARGVSA
jgi:putative peptidoglycan lipid II flippase